MALDLFHISDPPCIPGLVGCYDAAANTSGLDLIKLPDPPCIPGLVGCYDAAANTSGLDLIKLPDPPCIPGLMGCDAGTATINDTLDTPVSATQASGFPSIGSADTSSSSATTFSATFTPASGSSSSSSSASASAPSFGFSLADTIGRRRDAIAEYVLTAQNRGSGLLSGVKISHGPLSSGTTFDPSRSSAGCTQAGTSVVCTTDLAPGASKEILLSYHVSSSVSCPILRGLQQASITTEKPAQTPGSQALVSVRCSMLPSDAPVTVLGGASSSASSVTGVSSSPVSAMGNADGTTTPDSALPLVVGASSDSSRSSSEAASSIASISPTPVATIAVGGSDGQSTINPVQGVEKCIPGYRGEGGCPAAPRTGAALSFITASVTDGTGLTPFIPPASFSVSTSAWAGVASAIVIAVFSSYFLKKMIFRNLAN